MKESRLTFLLWPLALVYGVAARLKAWLYQAGIFHARKLPGAVLSVGNLTVGGTGKTPMVVWLCEQLLARGKSVGVLTRGYRRRSSKGEAAVTSDEIQIFLRHLGGRVRVGIGANRHQEGWKLSAEGVDCFVLDDGYQHMQLARDANILLVDATNPFGGGGLLPAGRLREPVSAMSRANVIVLTRSLGDSSLGKKIRRYSNAPIFFAQTRLERIVRLGPDFEFISDMSGEKQQFLAFCAIANPEAFRRDLERWGVRIKGYSAFPDHHRFKQSEVDALVLRAKDAGAEALLCTEKDVFNLQGCALRELPAYVCLISMQPTEPEKLWRSIEEAIAPRCGGAAV